MRNFKGSSFGADLGSPAVLKDNRAVGKRGFHFFGSFYSVLETRLSSTQGRTVSTSSLSAC